MHNNYFRKLMNYIRNVYNIDRLICKMKDSRINPTYRSGQVILIALFGTGLAQFGYCMVRRT